MRVLRVIPSLDATDGGPSTAARAMSTALARAGADVEQVATVAPGTSEVDDGRPHLRDGVTYRLFRRSLPGSYKYSRPIGRYLRDATAKFDVVHVEALFSYTTIPACRAAIRARVPYVLAPLGSLNAWSIRHRAWKKLPYFSLIERRHLEHAAALHANSETEAEALSAAGFGHLVHLIPLGVDAPTLSIPPARESGPLRVLYLSRLHPVKGLPLLFEAIAALRRAGTPVQLTVAGTGQPSYERTLGAIAASLGVADSIRFIGHVEGAAKDALFRTADVFALTSFQESFGLAVAEAMSYGLPVLVTDRVGIQRDVRDAGAGLVVAPDVGEIRDALLQFAREPLRRAEMGRRGSRLVRERFSWENTARRLLALYEEIAGRGRPAPVRTAASAS